MFEKAVVAALFPIIIGGAIFSYRLFRCPRKRPPVQELQPVDHTQQVLLLFSLLAVMSIALCIGYLFVLP